MNSSGVIEFKFDRGINLKMSQILMQDGATGIFLFGTVKHEGKDAPVFITHEKIPNMEQFVNEFINLVSRYGVNFSK